jgi:uncharacterized protein YkwD
VRSLAGALVVLLGCSLASCAADGDDNRPDGDPTSPAAVGPPRSYAGTLTQASNAARADEGLDPMRPSRCLSDAAADRAAEIAGGPLEHRPLPDIAERCTDTGRVAENLVRSAVPPAEVVEAWMQSAGHRNNLVDPAMREVGTGCRRDGADMLCVQLYLQDD